MARPRLPRNPAAMKELHEAHERYAQRLSELEGELEQLRAEREADWRTAAGGGIPAAAIADVLESRVSAVLKRRT